jgi:mannose-6-phosphate isomerase-like protein (cupin superfamily)
MIAKIFQSKLFTGKKAWDSLDIAQMSGNISIRLHWTDQPYIWHSNTGDEVFVVLEGSVTMYYKLEHVEHQVLLHPGDMFVAYDGCEHVAHPIGEARILVIEHKGSI